MLVVALRYVPARGDVVWKTFNPQAGHEQAGRRPALVLFSIAKVGLAIFCPITTQVKGYPFEVTIASGSKLGGVILAGQVNCVP
jgi:mRNA interferase MazF